jgi:hypothetical protein
MKRALVALVLLAACAVTPVQRREETLMREAHTFNDDLRWQRYESLHESMPLEEAQLLSARAAAMGDDMAMGDCEVLSVAFDPGSEKARVQVRLSWYSKRESTLRDATLEQRWEYQGGRWLMTKQRRLRGARFPLVTEPVAPPPAP